jgi:hypothetical protein
VNGSYAIMNEVLNPGVINIYAVTIIIGVILIMAVMIHFEHKG